MTRTPRSSRSFGIASSCLALFSCLLVACSGGGGGDNESTPTPGTILKQVELPATGFDGKSALLRTGGALDGRWSIVRDDVAVGPAVLLTPTGPNWWSEWLLNSGTSQWIGASNVQNPGAAPYSFEMSFELGDLDPSLTEMVGRWAIDDDGTLEVNGVQIASLTEADKVLSGNWIRLNEFKIGTGAGVLKPGKNVVRITIRETDNFLEGVRFEGALNLRSPR